HIGPKPCLCAREGAGEASAGERIGRPLSRESQIIPGADVLIPTEGDMAERDNASVPTARRGRRQGRGKMPRYLWDVNFCPQKTWREGVCIMGRPDFIWFCLDGFGVPSRP